MFFPTLFFLKISLAIQGLLWFDINFRIIFSNSEKHGIAILTGIALNLCITLGGTGILTVLTLPIREQGI